MLSPDDRSLYTDALTPPPGYIFEEAIGTTYSLDLETLLTVPLHLAMLGRRRGETPDPVELLEALQRVADRITIYAQRGRMTVPGGQHVLYGLLEQMVCEVASPGGGAFHPKLWVLRFDAPGEDVPLLRVLVLSRNLTSDRSWDLCLRLEGEPGAGPIAANGPLVELVRSLPGLAVSAAEDARPAQVVRLGELISRTAWTLPEGFDSVRFHLIRNHSWMPARSDRLAVISPFLTTGAIDALVGTTGAPVVLVSRPDALDALDKDPATSFSQVYALDDAAESEDGEEVASRDTVGLHAKALIAEAGSEVRLYIGSANATSAAMLNHQNVEVMTELVGRRNKLGGIEALLGSNGLQDYLSAWVPAENADDEQDDAQRCAEEALESARRLFGEADLSVHCSAVADDWQLRLQCAAPIATVGIAAVRTWPITVKDGLAANAGSLADGSAVDLGVFPTASVTGFIGFELTALAAPLQVRFALSLPLVNPPTDRLSAMLRKVLNNREGFLRYLLLLLGDFAGDPVMEPGGDPAGGYFGWNANATDELPLLEDLTRAFSRDRKKLIHVRRVVEELRKSTEGKQIVPEEFLALWDVFEAALGRREP